MSNYREYGWGENIPESTEILLRPIVDLLKKSDRILDVGCGNGSVTNLLMRAGYDIYGVDASVEGIEVANRNSSKEGRFYVCDINDGKLPKELEGIKFDVVISTEVIEHIYSPQRFMEFCRNAIPTGGAIILSTPYHGYLKNLLLSLTGHWDKHHTVLWEGGHIKFWSRKTLSELMYKNGITVTKFVGCGRMPYLWKSMILMGQI
jgi:2-polyprenyl-3-methyl-5-hydroxy-6-metoxy-1,4-benzoquinol methylase